MFTGKDVMTETSRRMKRKTWGEEKNRHGWGVRRRVREMGAEMVEGNEH